MIREYQEIDLPIIDKIFRESMFSISPSFVKLFMYIALPFMIIGYLLNVLMYSIYISIFLQILIHTGFYLYITIFNNKMLPSKHIYKYNSKESKILVLVNEHIIIGFVSMEPYYNPDTCWVTYMFIDPKFQGKGYGVELCRGLLEYGTYKLGYTKIMGATSSIQRSQIKLHKKFGKMLLEYKIQSKLEIYSKPIYKWFPIHEVMIIYTKL